MALPAEKQRVTVEEYLRAEVTATKRHEYADGEVFEMSGGSLEHSLIIMNFGAAIHAAVAGTPCRVLDGNMKVGIGRARRYVYPDIHVFCGRAQLDPSDPAGQTIVNPKLVVEVLSPSTEMYDRGAKFSGYRELQSLEEYVLVAQERPEVQTYFRQADGTWLFTPYAGVEGAVKLRSMGVELRLAAIYAGVEFPPEVAEPDPSAEKAP